MNRGTGEGTVKNHASVILSKLGVRDRARAVLKALDAERKHHDLRRTSFSGPAPPLDLFDQGSVLQPWRKDEIEQRVGRVEGVREVRNEIRVQPVSSFDDRLRLQLYRRIYGGALFERYATFVNPPIHIVVENGSITLTGVVNSRAEKAALESMARGALAFRVDNQVQVESDVEKEPSGKMSAES